MKPAEFRLTLILLAVVFGVSVSLLAGKALLYKQPVPTVNPASTVVPETSVTIAPAVNAPSAVASPSSVTTSPAETASPVAAEATASVPETVEPMQPSTTATKPAIKPAPTKPVPTKPATTKPAKTKPAKTVASAASPQASAKSTTATTTPTPTTASRTVARSTIEKPVRPKKGYLVFVFDDAGHNLEQLDPFLSLPFPCTIAVLPGLRYSGEAARKIRAAGKTVILHQPMQAINRSMDPGPGAITADMSADQIRAIVRKNLAEVGPVVGINNHEGSLITADRLAMEAVFDVVREKGIYFLDSRTNADTAAPSVARERNMTIWERSVFLDNSQEKADIIEAISGGMTIAEKKGSAIMIGHIWSNDLANILTSMYPELVSQGFSLSTIAEIATERDFGE